MTDSQHSRMMLASMTVSLPVHFVYAELTTRIGVCESSIQLQSSTRASGLMDEGEVSFHMQSDVSYGDIWNQCDEALTELDNRADPTT